MSMLPGISYSEYIQSESEELRRHNMAMDALMFRLHARQNVCQHEEKVRHPDPTGNNGSYFQCLLCGKCDV